MYCTQYKQIIIKKRFDLRMFQLNIVRSDITPIVYYAWARSFYNVDTKKKAIKDKGWGPLNKIYFSILKFHVQNRHC